MSAARRSVSATKEDISYSGDCLQWCMIVALWAVVVRLQGE
jgi:hypothetical protein